MPQQITEQNVNAFKTIYENYQANPGFFENQERSAEFLNAVNLYGDFLEQQKTQQVLPTEDITTTQESPLNPVADQIVKEAISPETVSILEAANPPDVQPQEDQSIVQRALGVIKEKIDISPEQEARFGELVQGFGLKPLDEEFQEAVEKTPTEKTGPEKAFTTVMEEGIFEPLRSINAGVQGAAANITQVLDGFAKKLEEKTGIKRGGLFGDLTKIFEANAERNRAKGVPEGQGIISDISRAIFEGGGQLGLDLPIIMSLGSWGLPVFTAIMGGGEAAGADESILKGVAKGTVEGIALHNILRGVRFLPRGAGEASGGALFGGLTLQAELQKPEGDVDWPTVAAQSLLGMVLTAQGRKIPQREFIENIRNEFSNGKESFIKWAEKNDIPKENAERFHTELKTQLDKTTAEAEQFRKDNPEVVKQIELDLAKDIKPIEEKPVEEIKPVEKVEPKKEKKKVSKPIKEVVEPKKVEKPPKIAKKPEKPTKVLKQEEITLKEKLERKEPIIKPKKISGVAKGIEERAIEANLTEGFKDLAEFTPTTIKKQAKLMSELAKDSDKTLRVIAGVEPVPKGLNPSTVITTMENRAIETKDGELSAALANSPLAAEGSTAGQTLGLLAERNPNSPVAKIKEIINLRKDRLKKRLKFNDQRKQQANLKKSLQNKIKRIAPKKTSWERLINDITCK